MKKKPIQSVGVLFFVLSILSVSSSLAAPVRGKKIKSASQPRSSYTPSLYGDDSSSDEVMNEKKFYLFGGIDLGYSTYSQSAVATDAKRSGMNFGVRGLAAFYTQQWVIDGGLGWAYFSNSGTPASGTDINVSTRTVYIDISPRYRIDKNWQVGVEGQYWFGKDNGLNANVFSEDPNNAIFAGLQGMYEWMKKDTKYRFGGRWLMDMNIADRNANIFQVFFQIGFSPGGGSNREYKKQQTEELKESDLIEVEPEPAPIPEPTPMQEIAPEPEPEPVVMSTPEPVATPEPPLAGPQKKMVLTLDVNSLPFESDSARLPKYHRDRVKEIGRFLGEHSEDWNRLVVGGHTDEQGKKAYNIKLSKARADTVRQLLGEGGAPTNKIKAVGYGPSKPLDRRHTKEAWAKNRRVELEFFGVKDGVVIQKALKK